MPAPGLLPLRKSPAFMLRPSSELLFQNGAPRPPLDPVVDWKFNGTPSKTSPGALTASAKAAAGINIAAATIPNFVIFSPMGSWGPANEYQLGLRVRDT